MLFHDRDEHIARETQIFFGKTAHDGGRHFDQVRHFGQQPFFDDGLAFDQVGGLFDLLDDQGFTFLHINYDSRFPDHIKIFIRGGDFDFGRIIRA